MLKAVYIDLTLWPREKNRGPKFEQQLLYLESLVESSLSDWGRYQVVQHILHPTKKNVPVSSFEGSQLLDDLVMPLD